jgi:hypothetical protein
MKKYRQEIRQWIAIVNKSGLEKHGELVSFLKEKHGFTHGNANMIVHYAKQSHAGAAENSDDLVTDQYKGKENLKAWYDKLMIEINKLGKDVELAPKKRISQEGRNIAIIQPSTKDRLDVGLNVKGVDPSGNVIASGTWNAMCTHRIKIEDEKMINKDLLEWIKKAYEQAG